MSQEQKITFFFLLLFLLLVFQSLIMSATDNKDEFDPSNVPILQEFVCAPAIFNAI